MDQKFCTTIMLADPRKSLRPRESHPGGIPEDDQRQLFLPVAEDAIGRFVDPPRVV